MQKKTKAPKKKAASPMTPNTPPDLEELILVGADASASVGATITKSKKPKTKRKPKSPPHTPPSPQSKAMPAMDHFEDMRAGVEIIKLDHQSAKPRKSGKGAKVSPELKQAFGDQAGFDFSNDLKVSIPNISSLAVAKTPRDPRTPDVVSPKTPKSPKTPTTPDGTGASKKKKKKKKKGTNT